MATAISDNFLVSTAPDAPDFSKTISQKLRLLDILTNIDDVRESSFHWSSRRHGGRFSTKTGSGANQFLWAEPHLKRSLALVIIVLDSGTSPPPERVLRYP